MNTNTFDVSNSLFTIADPFISLTSPNGGEVFTQCGSIPISWTKGGASSTSRLHYSLDDGATWVQISASVSGTGYIWQPVLISGSVKIKVTDYSNASLFDESDASFTILPNTDLIVTSPNGGETLTVGTYHTITWVDNNVSNCDIYYSLDNGSNWNAIDTYDPSDGSYSWLIPNTPSTQCLIRVRDVLDSYCRQDVSNAVFTIAQPSPVVTNPDGGENLYGGQATTITWTNQYMSAPFVQISVSYDGGSTYTDIVDVTENDGSYAWSIPEVYSETCLVRVKEVGGTAIEAISAAVFSILEPYVEITSPNGDNGVQDWRVCTETTITWTSVGTSNYFKIWYSVDNGNSWVSLNSNYYSPGINNAYNWVMPNIPSPAALIRVEDRYNALLQEYSDNTFTIAPALTLIVPNGGEVVAAGDVIPITWLNEGATNYYTLDYSSNGGSTWNSIIFNQQIAGNTYNWTVPAGLGTNYLVRIIDGVDGCKSDISDASFEVASSVPGQVAVLSPNGLEVWESCTQRQINWDNINTSDYFDLDYSTDGGNTWNNIVSNYFSLTGNYLWTIPNLNSTQVFVRVSDHNNLLYTDQNNVSFSIDGPAANAGNDVEICLGESIFLQGSGGIAYAWSPSVDLDNANSANPLASVNVTAEFMLTVTDENGCLDSDFVTVTINNQSCMIAGCMDDTAYNYNPFATVDNGFCLYTEGNGGGSGCQGDVNNDNVVNTADLNAILANFGSNCQ